MSIKIFFVVAVCFSAICICSSISYTNSGGTTAQWGLWRILSNSRPLYNNYDAEVMRKLNSTCDRVSPCNDVVVYIIGKGVNTDHEEFENGRVTWKYIAPAVYSREGPSRYDSLDTIAAGIIVGRTHGIAKQARVVVLKVQGRDGRTDDSNLHNALEWMCNDFRDRIETKGVALLAPFSHAISVHVENELVACERSTGLVFVSGAGDADKSRTTSDVSSLPILHLQTVITVGATTLNDEMASFSNYGRNVKILAPGDQLQANLKGHKQYELWNSTHLAAAYVVGVIARRLGFLPANAPSNSTAMINWLQSKALKFQIRFKSDMQKSTPNLLLYMACDEGTCIKAESTQITTVTQPNGTTPPLRMSSSTSDPSRGLSAQHTNFPDPSRIPGDFAFTAHIPAALFPPAVLVPCAVGIVLLVILFVIGSRYGKSGRNRTNNHPRQQGENHSIIGEASPRSPVTSSRVALNFVDAESRESESSDHQYVKVID